MPFPPVCLPFSSAHKFFFFCLSSSAVQVLESQRFPFWVEREESKGWGKIPPFARNSFFFYQQPMNSSVFKGRHHSAVSAYGVASLDIGGRQQVQVMKNGGGRCCKKIWERVPFHFQSGLLPKPMSTATTICPLRCNISQR